MDLEELRADDPEEDDSDFEFPEYSQIDPRQIELDLNIPVESEEPSPEDIGLNQPVVLEEPPN
jgi:hypothetical protein